MMARPLAHRDAMVADVVPFMKSQNFEFLRVRRAALADPRAWKTGVGTPATEAASLRREPSLGDQSERRRRPAVRLGGPSRAR